MISGESLTVWCSAWRPTAGESAGGGGGGAGGDGLLVGLTGFAEMDMDVDQAGGDGEAGGVEQLRRR